MRLPWRPREYEAVVAALREAEKELAASEIVRAAEARHTRRVQETVRNELRRRR